MIISTHFLLLYQCTTFSDIRYDSMPLYKMFLMAIMAILASAMAFAGKHAIPRDSLAVGGSPGNTDSLTFPTRLLRSTKLSEDE